MTKTYIVQEIHWDRRRKRWTEWALVFGVALSAKKEAVLALGDFAFECRDDHRDWFSDGHSIFVRVLEVSSPAPTYNTGMGSTPYVSILMERRITKRAKK